MAYAGIAPAWWQAGLLCRCPRCGVGKLYQGILTVRPTCTQCGLDLHPYDSGDGPAALVILVLGAFIVAMAFWVEFRFEPPLWVHVALWPVVTIPLAVLMIRPMKACLVAMEYSSRSAGPGR